jgi:WD40 repeat protein/serine/threonine protein kinase
MDGCPNGAELEAFLSDRLPPDLESRVLTHLESCSACQQILEDLTATAIADPHRSRAHPHGTLPARRKPYPLPSRIGQYTVIRELGQGGMGVVYLAEQANLKRSVALKVIRHGVNATADEVARFRAEAEAVARLQHPNIVHIHEVGSQDGLHYLALEYVDGGSLDRLLAGTPQESQASAQLVETLARAVHHAHQRGILHRDLKPANILLAVEGGGWRVEGKETEQPPPLNLHPLPSTLHPKITDFGLAKRLEPGDARTQSGLVLGTPSYLAPEQVSGKHGAVTPAVDVYGLGAVLYEMLTGRPPFKGATALSTLEQVASQEPLAPSRFHRHIPPDLETICLKCLEKQPGKRYASALALAEDLHRFLSGRPILARPIRVWGRIGKWARRRPLDAGLTAAVLLIAVLGFAGIVWQWRNALAERENAVAEQENARRQSYRANMLAAGSALQVSNTVAARRILEAVREEYPQWEWRHFHSQLDNASRVLTGHQGPVHGVAFSPDGSRLASLAQDHTLRLWEVATGRELASARGQDYTALAFSPDGSLLASGDDDHSVRLWDARTGAARGTCRGHAGSIQALAFSPDSRRLVSAANPDDEPCRLWDMATGTLVAVLPARAGAQGLFFTPDGTRIVCCRDDAIHVLAATGGKELVAWHVPGASSLCCAVSRDGRRLVTGSDFPDNGVRLWDLDTGALRAELRGHRNRVMSVAFSPDGRRIASASQDQTVRVWDAADGRPIATLQGHTSAVGQALFSPDGTRLISAAFDGIMRLWDPADGEQLSVFQGHAEPIWSIAWSADGTRLASASLDHTVRLWDVALVERNGVLRGHDSYVYDVAFSPDGVHIGSAAWDNSVRLWEPTTGRQTALLKGPGPWDPGRRRPDEAAVRGDGGNFLLALAFSPDGSQVVAGSRDSKVQFWDVKTGNLRHTEQVPGKGVNSLAFSPDGARVAAALGSPYPDRKEGNYVLLLDAQNGATLRTLADHTDGVLAVRFAPDGRRLVSAGFDKTVRVWDAATGELVRVLTGHGDTVDAVAFSKDGTLLASASHDRSVRLWDAETLEPLGCPLPHPSIVYAVAFSPDGRRLAAGCEDNTIRLWDVATRQEVAELRGHKAYVHALAFDPDGSRLVSASGDFTVRVWDTLSPQERSGAARETQVRVGAFRPACRDKPFPPLLRSASFDRIFAGKITQSGL